MTTSAAFASSVLVGVGAANATADTSWTAPVNTTNLAWSGSGIGSLGAKITEIDYIGLGTTLAGLINMFLYDNNGNYHLFDSVAISAVPASTTAPPFALRRPYTYLFIPTGWTIRFTSTVANQLIEVNAYGGNF